jgi:hypothetical protein
MRLRKIEQQVRFAQIFAAQCAFHAVTVEYNRWHEPAAIALQKSVARCLLRSTKEL